MSPPRTAAALVSAALFAIYLAMLAPSVAPGDSGELVAVGCSLGVAHPPGYPLFTLLTAAATRVPVFNEPAARANALSALLQALTCGVLLLAVHAFTENLPAGIAAALALGTSRTFWLYGLQAEVFPLNNLFAAILLWLAVRLATHHRSQPPQRSFFAAIFFLASLGTITHHTTLVIVALPVCIALTWQSRKCTWSPATKSRTVYAASAALLLGLLPLAYLPIAARTNPILNWDDPRDLGSLQRLLSREDYGSTHLVPEETVQNLVEAHGESVRPGSFDNFRRLFAELPRNFFWITPVLMLLGAFALIRKRSLLTGIFAGIFALIALFYARVNMPQLDIYLGVADRFRLLPDVCFSFLAGIGFARIADRLPRKRWAAPGLIALMLTPAALSNASAVNQRGNTFTADFGKNVLASLPDYALLFSAGDQIHNALYYRTLCLHERPDVTLVDINKLSFAWHLPAFRRAVPDVHFAPDMVKHVGTDPASWNIEWVRRNLDRRPVFFYNPGSDTSYATTYASVPWGLVSRVFPKAQTPSLDDQLVAEEAIFARMDLRSLNDPLEARSIERDTLHGYVPFLGRLAFLREMAGRTHDAEEALALAQRIADPPTLANLWAQNAADLVSTASSRTRQDALVLYRRAETLYLRALAADNAHFSSLINLSSLYRDVPELGHGGEALDLLERAVRTRPFELTHLKALSDEAEARTDVALQRRARVYGKKAIEVYELRLAVAPPDNEPALSRQIEALRGFLASPIVERR